MQLFRNQTLFAHLCVESNQCWCAHACVEFTENCVVRMQQLCVHQFGRRLHSLCVILQRSKFIVTDIVPTAHFYISVHAMVLGGPWYRQLYNRLNSIKAISWHRPHQLRGRLPIHPSYSDPPNQPRYGPYSLSPHNREEHET